MDKKFINQLRGQLKDRRHHLLKEVKLRLREFRGLWWVQAHRYGRHCV